MPTYDYKCKDCTESFVEVHSFKSTSSGCPHCKSSEVEKTISLFAAKTDQSFEKALRKYERQGIKDNQRFHKDDKFAANITGADDPNHKKKITKVLQDQAKKNEESRKKVKRVNE